jgi:hypothetical protein
VFDTILKRVPWVIAAIMVLAVTGQAALAGTDDGVAPSAVANVNADRIDGRHAIKYTSNTTARKGKLMAIGATGYLPNNIIQKAMDADKIDGIDSTALATIAALQNPAGAVNEADNLVHWNQLFGVPPTVVSGTTRSFIAAESPVIPAGNTYSFSIDQPVGLDVEWALIPTTVGQTVYMYDDPITGEGEGFQRTAAGTLRHWILIKNFNVASTVKVRVTVWNDSYVAPSAARKMVKVTFFETKKARRMVGIN